MLLKDTIFLFKNTWKRKKYIGKCKGKYENFLKRFDINLVILSVTSGIIKIASVISATSASVGIAFFLFFYLLALSNGLSSYTNEMINEK